MARNDERSIRRIDTESGRRPNAESYGADAGGTKQYRSLCGKCGARRVDAQLGLEPTPDEFVAAMVGVFREVWRVLHPSGTVWLNIGDSYAGSWGAQSRLNGNDVGSTLEGGSMLSARQIAAHPKRESGTGSLKNTPGLKPKDLCMIPARLALALQADGWYLRSEIIWCKPNPMPESVTDRPTKSHEQVYLLSKQERYYFDAEAVRETNSGTKPWGKLTRPKDALQKADIPSDMTARRREFDKYRDTESGRNLRSVWTIATESFPGSHFATFPRALVFPCIRAGTSERGCCPRCGAPWVREVERELVATRGKVGEHKGQGRADLMDAGSQWNHSGGVYGHYEVTTTGWRPSCPHGLDPVPCTVLDVFAGSGTTLVVAEALGRRGIGVELSAEYLAIARRRLEHPHAAVPRTGRQEYHPLFGDAP